MFLLLKISGRGEGSGPLDPPSYGLASSQDINRFISPNIDIEYRLIIYTDNSIAFGKVSQNLKIQNIYLRIVYIVRK
jgi:hypothetical protein